MGALAERDVLAGRLTGEVKLISRRAPVRLVTVRRRDPTDNFLAGGDRHPADVVVARADPTHVLRR